MATGHANIFPNTHANHGNFWHAYTAVSKERMTEITVAVI